MPARLQMALDHHDGVAPALLELVNGCRAYRGYREEADGAPDARRQAGLPAAVSRECAIEMIFAVIGQDLPAQTPAVNKGSQ